ncbi:DNA translocase FtsK [Vagococcus entomophilus]|nr:DNA translocase FtsK [Vagococcus entomophilus]
MAKKATRKKTTKKKKQQKNRQNYLIMGLILLLFSLLGIFKLGFLGVLVANVFRLLVGDTYPILAGIVAVYGGFLVLLGKEPELKRPRIVVGIGFLYLGVLLFLHAHLFSETVANNHHFISLTWQKLFTDIRTNVVSQSVGGGMIGAAIYTLLHFLVSQIGVYVVGTSLVIIGGCLLSNVSSNELMEKIHSFQVKFQEKWHLHREKRQEKLKLKEEKQEIAKKQAAEKHAQEQALKAQTEVEQESPQVAENVIVQEELPLKIDTYQSKYEQQQAKKSQSMEDKHEASEDNGEDLEFEIPQELEDIDYQLPTSVLLNEIPMTDQSEEYQSIEKNVGVLEQTFKSFGVDAKVVRASLGPAVTKYEIQPAVGVKVSKVVSLTDDLALALAAKDIRMEAPIPGKSLIGIEVPNNTVSTVSFRDIIEAQPSHPDQLLEVPLGRDISGSVISADLTKMPHMLIAGSTGSGKSVCINGIITSILMRAKPNEVKLMMIDPKMVELNVYNGIPHLLTPVVTNPRKASQALHKVVEEMEKRYELFAGTGVRNITGYNEFVARRNAEEGSNQPILPFIVVVVDELADLMMVASNEVEDAIIRLAQMARAAGIHMILATQRPSVDVITGIIKANVPSRIAFAVSSGTDSRTIIDSNGAEKLLGRGDMLFLPMGQNKPIRVQGAFISDQEVERIVASVTEQQGADYQENMMPSEEAEVSSSGEAEDEYYQEALEMVVEMQTASISLLQRRFRIGYNRAARLIDEMEMRGVIGPSEGSKPRKVLLDTLPNAQIEMEHQVEPPVE